MLLRDQLSTGFTLATGRWSIVPLAKTVSWSSGNESQLGVDYKKKGWKMFRPCIYSNSWENPFVQLPSG